jgi:hypothetical protein
VARLASKIIQFSNGLLSTAADLVLFRIYLGVDWEVNPESGQVNRWPGAEVFPELPELTPAKVSRSLRFLLKNKLITFAPNLAISKEGGERLDTLFPVYQEKRPWDGNLYIINYEVPVRDNSSRDALRRFVKSLGAGMLQSSSWIVPHDPSESLSKYIVQKELAVSIFISSFLAEISLKDRGHLELLADVYGLEELNRRYQEFIGKVQKIRDIHGSTQKMALAFEYFAILKDDPQLPFKLMGKGYLGGEAWKVFEARFFA